MHQIIDPNIHEQLKSKHLFQSPTPNSPYLRKEGSGWSSTTASSPLVSSIQFQFPLDSLLHQQSQPSEGEKGREWETDRFIPKRKCMRVGSFMEQGEEQHDSENEGIQKDHKQGSISDIYKKMLIDQAHQNAPLSHLSSFHNKNILQFSKQSSQQPLFGIARHQNQLSWTEDMSISAPKARKVNKLPIKVLDAPSLQDDYYLNLLDWGSQNQLAVGLASSVYLWNAANSKVSKLCDLGESQVTGLGWALNSPHIAIGSQSGVVQIWDIQKMRRIRSMKGHSNRVGAVSWNSTILSTGSRDKTILNRDTREAPDFCSKFQGHKQQVCGLKWSPDEQQLCSGGNDNKLLVWSPRISEPVLKFCDHQAAVKAVAWSPHQHGALASGGGTADRTIRFRNTLYGTTTKVVDAGSQVCNLLFSKTTQELVSTHGYQLNEVNLWKLPSMTKMASLTGHTSRVLYLAMSPDGSTVVTGAGDETLRFWKLFPSGSEGPRKNQALLSTETVLIR